MKFNKTTLSSWKFNLKWRTLDSYILKKFLGSFFYSIALLMAVIIIFDISENIQRFLDNDVPFFRIIFGYYCNFIPFFISLFTPLFTFISVIWFTSQLSQRNEFVAILSGGINFYRLIVPYFTGALIIAVLTFFMSNFVIPHTNARLNDFKNTYFYHHHFSYSNIHIKNSSNTYIYIQRWDQAENIGDMFTYEELGKDAISYKLSAGTISYQVDSGRWILNDYVKRTVSEGKESVITGRQMDTVLNITPQNLNKNVAAIAEMTDKDLRKVIKEEKEKNSSFVKYYQMEKSKRLANSLGSIIMTLLGLSVASRKTHRGVGVHLFIGMGMAFSFIFLQQVSDVFAISGGISPSLGAFIPNLIFLIICICMLRFTQK